MLQSVGVISVCGVVQSHGVMVVSGSGHGVGVVNSHGSVGHSVTGQSVGEKVVGQLQASVVSGLVVGLGPSVGG